MLNKSNVAVMLRLKKLKKWISASSCITNVPPAPECIFLRTLQILCDDNEVKLDFP